VAASIFVLAVSSHYLLKGRDLAFARRSFAVAAGFGLASILSVIVLGDETGYVVGQVQKVKLAAMEAEWETEPPPSHFTLFGFPDQKEQNTAAEIKLPWLGGIIVTRSIDKPVPGIKDIIAESGQRIRSGMVAYEHLEKIRGGDRSDTNLAQFNDNKENLGYGLLLRRYTPKVSDATDQQIKQAALDTIPNVASMFWSFRIMVGLGFYMLALIALSFYYCAKRVFDQKRWFLKILVISLPIPWIAIELGWFVAEYGRQPWTIGGILPTYLSTSTLTTGDIIGTLIVVIALYTLFLIVEIFLMTKFIRQGPSSLHTGRYHFEQENVT
jgi:cytochrome d ubiquinol oxidase subunit I